MTSLADPKTAFRPKPTTRSSPPTESSLNLPSDKGIKERFNAISLRMSEHIHQVAVESCVDRVCYVVCPVL